MRPARTSTAWAAAVKARRAEITAEIALKSAAARADNVRSKSTTAR